MVSTIIIISGVRAERARAGERASERATGREFKWATDERAADVRRLHGAVSCAMRSECSEAVSDSSGDSTHVGTRQVHGFSRLNEPWRMPHISNPLRASRPTHEVRDLKLVSRGSQGPARAEAASISFGAGRRTSNKKQLVAKWLSARCASLFAVRTREIRWRAQNVSSIFGGNVKTLCDATTT